jgi:hypothetical protein
MGCDAPSCNVHNKFQYKSSSTFQVQHISTPVQSAQPCSLSHAPRKQGVSPAAHATAPHALVADRMHDRCHAAA